MIRRWKWLNTLLWRMVGSPCVLPPIERTPVHRDLAFPVYCDRELP